MLILESLLITRLIGENGFKVSKSWKDGCVAL